jgi:hypothetical protein
MRNILVVLALGLTVGVVMADEPTDDLLASPIPMEYTEPGGTVDLMAPCGSFEYSGCWDMQPVDAVYYEPDQASDGNWVLVHGRTGITPRPDEVAYYCWPAGALDGYIHFVLYADKECTTNDVHRLNHSRMSLIRYESGRWIRFTDYFGLLEYEDCGAWFNWQHEAYWFDGLEGYTQYDICLSIESLFPGIYRSEFWRDNLRLTANEITDRIFLPVILRDD